MTKKTFIISSQYFWGFKTIIDLDIFKNKTKPEIVEKVIDTLRHVLRSNNLIVLLEMLDGLHGHTKIDFHVHDCSIEQIYDSNNRDAIYICSH